MKKSLLSFLIGVTVILVGVQLVSARLYNPQTVTSGDFTLNGDLLPGANNTYDIGVFGNAWRNIYASGTLITAGSGTSTISGNLEVLGNTRLGNASTDMVDITGRLSTDLIPASPTDLGSTANPFNNVYTRFIDGDVDIQFAQDIRTTSGGNNVLDIGKYGGAWRDIYASGTVRASVTLVGAGTAGAPTYSFDGDTDTGIWRSAANTVNITGNGSANGLQIASTITAQVLLSTQDVRPTANNTMDIGTFNGLAYRDISASGTLRINTILGTEGIFASGTIRASSSLITGAGGIGSTYRVGAVESVDASLNQLIQVASSTVTGDLTVDFTDAGLVDCLIKPRIFITPEFDSNDDNLLSCTPHTVSATGFTIECELGSGDGVGAVHAADATAREVNWMVVCPTP